MVPNLFYAVAHLSLSAERRGPPSQKYRQIYSPSSFRSKYEQTNMCFAIIHRILFNFGLSNTKHTVICDFCSCVMFLTSVNSWLRCGKNASKIVFWREVESIWTLCFHVHRAENPDSHMCWGKVTFWELLFQHLDRYQTPSAKYHELY